MSTPYLPLGIVSAYADAKRGGYTGTYDEFCALLAGIGGLQPKLTAGQNISISGSVIATKAFPCNPNLLDNWYFGNPVNQRGQTSYTGGGYGIDGWLTQTPWGESVETVTVEDGCIKLTSAAAPDYPTSYGKWQQIIEAKAALVGKVVTAAIFVESVVPGDGPGVFLGIGDNSNVVPGNEVQITTPGVYAVTKPWTETIDRVYVRVSRGSTTPAEVSIKAISLELGSVQTLAHQEADGSWALNEIPDYAEQLLKCQRYLIPLSSYQCPASRLEADVILFFVPLPVTMRALPAIKQNDFQVLSKSGEAQTGFTFSVSSLTSNGVIISAAKTGHGMTDAVLSAGTLSLLSAEL